MSYAMEPTEHFRQHDSAQQRRDDAYTRAHDSLQQEVIDALMQDPARIVSAPGTRASFGGEPITEVFDSYLAGPNATQRRRALLRILARAAASTDPLLRLPTQAMLSECGAEHADMHAGEAVADECEMSREVY